MENEPLDESKKKQMMLVSLKHPNELMGEFYYHSDVYSAVEGLHSELGDWLDQAKALMVEDLLEKWFPDIMKTIEKQKIDDDIDYNSMDPWEAESFGGYPDDFGS